MADLVTEAIYALIYIGSKRRMANVLSKMIPDTCKTYVEPFCGSAALALNSRKFDKKILNDVNPHIANFWTVLSSANTAKAMIDLLEKTTYSRTEFENAKYRRETYGANRRDVIQWAVDTYVINQQSYDGNNEDWTPAMSKRYYNHIKSFTGLRLVCKKLESDHVEVHNENALGLLSSLEILDKKDAFIFLDPPYLGGLRNEKLYQCEMTDRAGGCGGPGSAVVGKSNNGGTVAQLSVVGKPDNGKSVNGKPVAGKSNAIKYK